MDELLTPPVDASPLIVWKYLLGAIVLAAAALVLARGLKTSRPASLVAQSHAALVGVLLLLIYAAGECVTEGFSVQTGLALALPLGLLGLVGLSHAWAAELLGQVASEAAGASDGSVSAPGETAVPEEGTSENRRAA